MNNYYYEQLVIAVWIICACKIKGVAHLFYSEKPLGTHRKITNCVTQDNSIKQEAMNLHPLYYYRLPQDGFFLFLRKWSFFPGSYII